MKNKLGRPKILNPKKLRTCRIKEEDFQKIKEVFGSLQNLIDLQVRKIRQK
jgi:hypothetical protein